MKAEFLYLDAIKECIERIERFTGRGRRFFLKDEKTQDAVLRNFQVLGDAVKDLSESFRAAHSEVRWSEFAQFRDKVTHGYLGIDLDRVWDFKDTEMQLLKEKLKQIYKEQDREW